MVEAFEAGVEHAPRWQDAHTIAAGIRVPQAVGDFLILRAVRESGGFAIAVDDAADRRGLARRSRRRRVAALSGGRGDAGCGQRRTRAALVAPGASVVLFNCASGYKYPLPGEARTLDRHAPIDYASL